MPARVNTRPAAQDPRRLLAELIRADAAHPAYQPSLTRDDIVAVTGRTRSQVDYAVEKGWLHGTPGIRDGHRCSLFTPAEAARWNKNPYRRQAND